MKPIYTYHIDFTIGDKRISIYHWAVSTPKTCFLFTCGEQFDRRLNKDDSINCDIDKELIVYCKKHNFDLQKFYNSIKGKDFVQAFEITHRVLKPYQDSKNQVWNSPVRINIFDVTGVYA